MRRFLSFPIADLQQIKWQMLNWSNRFNICCFLDNHNYNFSHHSIECVLAAGSLHEIHSLKELSDHYVNNNDWLFGHFGYDLKNEIEKLSSTRPDYIGFTNIFFFIPEVIVQLKGEELNIGIINGSHEEIFNGISSAFSGRLGGGRSPQQPSAGEQPNTGISNAAAISRWRECSSRSEEGGWTSALKIKQRFTKEEYINTVEKLRQHILRGDCYEINLCQEFYAENVVINPEELYKRLSNNSPNPFSAYYKLEDKYLSCLSPERYLKKEGDNILSQPIKGTSARKADELADEASKIALQTSEKERAENIMIVDLVRNDLSKICRKGTVHLDELCEIYSFPQVHQMISTISGELKENITLEEIIRSTFPMGSMTGAPKKRVMELIEEYELSRRGLFSGSIGYINPANDFDFNVVIRSALYNKTNKYLSFHTGSAITFNSDAEKEYEECLLKAAAIKKALAEANTFH